MTAHCRTSANAEANAAQETNVRALTGIAPV
jgi:hypothetical protein